MPTKISMAEKGKMAEIVEKDLHMVNTEITRQFRKLWEEARKEIEHELGFEEKKKEIADINKQIEELKKKINEIQNSMTEYRHHPDLKDYQDAGLKLPDNHNGYIYHHNTRYMGIPITTKMDVLIVQRIKDRCDPEKPVEMLAEVAESAHRALVMAGTYDEAREAYHLFYSLDFQKYGVKIPRLLGELKKVVGKNLLSAKMDAAPRLGHAEDNGEQPEEKPKKKPREKATTK